MLHSKVGSSRRSDYSVTFSDTQNLELIRRRLVKACLILKSNADVGRSWREDMVELGKRVTKVDLQDTLEIIQQYISGLERHARIIDSLLDRLNGTSKLVRQILPSKLLSSPIQLFQMLEYRNDELSIRTNTAVKNNAEQLKTITEQAVAANDSMTTLTADINNDSKFIKILTLIAVLYTPASLIAVSNPKMVAL